MSVKVSPMNKILAANNTQSAFGQSLNNLKQQNNEKKQSQDVIYHKRINSHGVNQINKQSAIQT